MQGNLLRTKLTIWNGERNMKVQAGMARMLINIFSKIAQIARSRPIPFDVPCKRYEREPFFVSRRNIARRYGKYMRITCNVHERTVRTYQTFVENKGGWRREKEKREMKIERGTSTFQERRRRQTRQKASPISQTCPICVVCKINHALPCHTTLSGSPRGPTIFKSIRSHTVIQFLRRNFSPI